MPTPLDYSNVPDWGTLASVGPYYSNTSFNSPGAANNPVVTGTAGGPDLRDGYQQAQDYLHNWQTPALPTGAAGSADWERQWKAAMGQWDQYGAASRTQPSIYDQYRNNYGANWMDDPRRVAQANQDTQFQKSNDDWWANQPARTPQQMQASHQQFMAAHPALAAHWNNRPRPSAPLAQTVGQLNPMHPFPPQGVTQAANGNFGVLGGAGGTGLPPTPMPNQLGGFYTQPGVRGPGFGNT